MHLSDEQLHEYLDQAFAPETRAEAVKHLADCVDCTARLSALQALFVTIESLPEAKLSRDLAGPVTRTLGGRVALPRWIRLTAGLQAALAVIALALAAPILNEYVSPFIADYQPPSLTEFLVQIQTQWALWVGSVSEFTLPTIPSLSLDLSSLALTLAAITAFLLWVVGNGLLLRRMTKSSR